MTSEHETGGERVVQALEDTGISTVFGIPGGHILEIYDHLVESTLQHVMARHENSVVRMASGYSREQGKIGVGLATSGPGGTNAITALAEANVLSTPVLFIVSYQPKPDAVHALQNPDFLLDAMESITKETTVVKDPDDIYDAIRTGIVIAENQRPGPVAVAIDKIAITAPITNDIVWEPPSDNEQDDVDIEMLAHTIDASCSPVIVCGQGSVTHQLDQQILELSETILAPVICTERGLGAVGREHANYAGVYSWHAKHPLASTVIQKSDLLIEIGVREHSQRLFDEIDCSKIGISDEFLRRRVTGCWGSNPSSLIETLATQVQPRSDHPINEEFLEQGQQQHRHLLDEKLQDDDLHPGQALSS